MSTHTATNSSPGLGAAPSTTPAARRPSTAGYWAGTLGGDNLLGGWGPQVVGVVALLLGGLLVGLTMVVITAVRRSGSTC